MTSKVQIYNALDRAIEVIEAAQFVETLQSRADAAYGYLDCAREFGLIEPATFRFYSAVIFAKKNDRLKELLA